MDMGRTAGFARWMIAGLMGLSVWLGWSSGQCAADDPNDPESLQFFETRIRPVLVERCYSCHSAEAAAEGKLRGGLALDTREGIRRGGDSGPAVVPGDLKSSWLIDALQHVTFEMPPEGKLDAAVIADFERWVERGAVDPREGAAAATRVAIDIEAGRQHWAFQPLSEAATPVAQVGAISSNWPDSYVDRWLAEAQQRKGVQPNPLAPPRVLVRRLFFDLIGLPPAPEEMEQWVARLAPEGEASGPIDAQAYEQLVQRLLDDPHFGERWARHWMDVARFAESFGYEQDYDRPNAYHYRDFLIRAFNDDLPYDQFVQWQLAGDELAPESPLAMMATGFLGAGAFPTQLTEEEFEKTRYDELDDMVSTIGVAFLGLSIGCARCHDHKYDPIPAQDYYRMASVFTTTIRSEIDLQIDPAADAERRSQWEQRLGELEAELQRVEREEVADAFDRWRADPAAALPESGVWQRLEGTILSTAGTRFEPQPDGSYLAVGAAPRGETTTFTSAITTEGEWRSLRLEALADPSLPHSGPGRAGNGNFALGDVQVALLLPNGERQSVKLSDARATHQQDEGSLSVRASIDGDRVSGWAVDGRIGESQAAVFEFAEPLQVEPGSHLEVTTVFEHPNASHVAGRVRWSATAVEGAMPEVQIPGPGAEVIAALEAVRGGSADEAAQQLAGNWFRDSVPAYVAARGALDAHRAAGPPRTTQRVLVTTEGQPHLPHHADDRGFPHFYPETYVLRRGEVSQRVEPATPGGLQVLTRSGLDLDAWYSPPPAGSPLRYQRAALAKWITDTENGPGLLTARVIVNRLWMLHFGRGIVTTVNDFGVMGAKPDHPELLDALARELIESGWSLKRLHWRIVTSAAYARSSSLDERGGRVDPEVVTYWRRVPRRLEAEAIRDAMLAVSNELDPTMFGPGTLDPQMKRRSVYFFIKRSQLIPMMMLFDWPEHLGSIGQRSTTTVAPQALAFLNGPQGRAYATSFASRVTERFAAERAREDALEAAYRHAFGRSPSDDELQLASQFLEQQTRQRIESESLNESRARELAWIDFCQALLSANEFIYVD